MNNEALIRNLRAAPTSHLMTHAADVIEQLEKTMKLRQAVITVLESEVNELLAQMAAIGAGGVSQGAPLNVRERLMPYLQACEHAWHSVQKEGTPENNRAFDDARIKFWEAL